MIGSIVPYCLNLYLLTPFSSVLLFRFSFLDKIVPAHKLVVVAQSEHFRKMFSGSFRESQSNLIQIFDCTEAVFSEVLKFLYTGECNIVEDNCFNILEQANFFQLGRLTAMCMSSIECL